MCFGKGSHRNFFEYSLYIVLNIVLSIHVLQWLAFNSGNNGWVTGYVDRNNLNQLDNWIRFFEYMLYDLLLSIATSFFICYVFVMFGDNGFDV